MTKEIKQENTKEEAGQKTKKIKQENTKEEAGQKTIENATVQELQAEAFIIGEQIKALQRNYNIIYETIKNKMSKEQNDNRQRN